MICIFLQHTGESMSNPQNRQVQQARPPVSSSLSAFPHLLQVYGQLQVIKPLPFTIFLPRLPPVASTIDIPLGKFQLHFVGSDSQALVAFCLGVKVDTPQLLEGFYTAGGAI